MGSVIRVVKLVWKILWYFICISLVVRMALAIFTDYPPPLDLTERSTQVIFAGGLIGWGVWEALRYWQRRRQRAFRNQLLISSSS